MSGGKLRQVVGYTQYSKTSTSSKPLPSAIGAFRVILGAGAETTFSQKEGRVIHPCPGPGVSRYFDLLSGVKQTV